MKTGLTFVTFLVALLTGSALAQSACREARARTADHREAFTVFGISLPSHSGSGPIAALALIPDKSHDPAGAFVFLLSRLVASEPEQIVEMLPAAIDLATAGRPVIIIQRTLSWPIVDQSVGQMQQDALCAEQWLSAHAPVKPDSWEFVGPQADIPAFDQLHAMGDNNSMTFIWGFPLGGLNEDSNTNLVLHHGSINIAALTNHE